MASLLIHIKSKMLLRAIRTPRRGRKAIRAKNGAAAAGTRKYKNAAQMLLQKQHIEDAVVSNPR